MPTTGTVSARRTAAAMSRTSRCAMLAVLGELVVIHRSAIIPDGTR
jgi:hypothetical protein